MNGVIIDREIGTVFIRTRTSGRDYRHHVYISDSNVECTGRSCRTFVGSTDYEGEIMECMHIRSARTILEEQRDNITMITHELIVPDDLVARNRLSNVISSESIENILDLMNECSEFNMQLIVESSEDSIELRNFSVYAWSSGERNYVKYLVKEDKMLCSGSGCEKSLCIHINICRWAVFQGSIGRSSQDTVSESFDLDRAYAEYYF